ncbi:zinc finger and BTB domain-containing protein 47-like [Haliotis rubra]|uniref:zinc finger and BTB domain-containing protein 47-like n=1 Tax=Haliotis rubra TaxID=36100 RepID=UPI001EE60134|nr:zinc finger and BTB domain-containing protein 47-like [Haliotis rubra]
MSDHTTCLIFTCEHCHQNFKYKRNLVRHQKYCAREGALYACQYCQKQFNRRDSLKRHSKICKQKVVYCRQCPHCFLYFSNEIDYQMHPCATNRASTSNNASTHTCQTCNQSFQTSKALRLHKNETNHGMLGRGKGKASRQKTKSATVTVPHHSPPVLSPTTSHPSPHTCQTCNQSFRTSKALRLHKNETSHDMVGRGKGKARQKTKSTTVSVQQDSPAGSPPTTSHPSANDSSDASKPCSYQALNGDVREYDIQEGTATDALEFLVREQNSVISMLELEIKEKSQLNGHYVYISRWRNQVKVVMQIIMKPILEARCR